MAEETKFTLKIGIIVSLVATIVMFIFNVLWIHNGDISMLRTNQVAVMKNVEKHDLMLDQIPARLASIDTQLSFLIQQQGVYGKISTDNNKILKNGHK